MLWLSRESLQDEQLIVLHNAELLVYHINMWSIKTFGYLEKPYQGETIKLPILLQHD
jgi:hypothetical protein